MEIYKYLRNECMDIKRSVCAGGAFLCTRRRGSFQLSFFVKERQPLRCNVQPESQNTCFPHNIIKNETGNIERRMHITQNYHKKKHSPIGTITQEFVISTHAPLSGVRLIVS